MNALNTVSKASLFANTGRSFAFIFDTNASCHAKRIIYDTGYVKNSPETAAESRFVTFSAQQP